MACTPSQSAELTFWRSDRSTSRVRGVAARSSDQAVKSAPRIASRSPSGFASYDQAHGG